MESLAISFTIYGFVIILTLLYGLLRFHLQFWRRRGIPHREPAFLFGNLQCVLEKRHIREAFSKVYQEFKSTGPFCGFFLLMKPAVIVFDLDLVKKVVIKDFNLFEERGMYYNGKDDPLTAHLFNVEAEEWRKMRNKLSPTFTSGKMKLMFPIVAKIGQECNNVLNEMLRAGPHIDVKELMARYTTDVIGTCAFGLDCNSLKNPEAEFRVMNRNIFTNFRHSRVVHLFMQLLPQVSKTLRMKELLDETHDFYFRIVKETMDYREKNHIKRNDFIDLLIEMKNSKDKDKRLDMNEITANAFAFFLAGFETSATTMTYALYEMALQPRVQDKLRKEILLVLEKNNQELTYENLKEMPYLQQLVQETLRKYAVFPFLQRKAKIDYDTKIPGYIIPKDTLAIIPIDAIHHDPEIYPEPQQFRPERFNAEEVAARHPMTWLPFGAGPRNCIGLRFGKMQTYVGLVSVLKNYKFTLCDKTPIPIGLNVQLPLMTPIQEVVLNVEKICDK
ncbi:cytochrome P450-6a17-like [Lucilia cuprina]